VLRAIAADDRARFHEGSAGRTLCEADVGLFPPQDLRLPLAARVEALPVETCEHRTSGVPPQLAGRPRASGRGSPTGSS